MPCLKAVTSKDGNFLVVIEGQFESRQISLKVFPKENWINAKDRLTAQSPYWTDSLLWSLVGDPHQSGWESCPLPLITDDGEFLILLNRATIVPPDLEALQIYRRRDHPGDRIREGSDHPGVLVRTILFKEIWPTRRFENDQRATDHSPQWFVGSSFEFSADNQYLLYKAGPDDTIHIRLKDALVTKN
jgi:hypothetical protein